MPDEKSKRAHCAASETELLADDELEAILRDAVEALIARLDPVLGEPVRRAEILEQPLCDIAADMKLSEREVRQRLRAGRRKLLRLVMLTLQERWDSSLHPLNSAGLAHCET